MRSDRRLSDAVTDDAGKDPIGCHHRRRQHHPLQIRRSIGAALMSRPSGLFPVVYRFREMLRNGLPALHELLPTVLGTAQKPFRNNRSTPGACLQASGTASAGAKLRHPL